jgi:hypothetical protein
MLLRKVKTSAKFSGVPSMFVTRPLAAGREGGDAAEGKRQPFHTHKSHSLLGHQVVSGQGNSQQRRRRFE